MEIKERIKKLGPYFKEMQITNSDGQQVIYVVVNFPHGWVIDDDIEEKFNVTVSDSNMIDEYYFCADIDTGEEAIFDAIDYNVKKMQSAIERAQLLAAKTKELRSLFEDEDITLEMLKTLKFEYDNSKEEIILPKKAGKKKNNEPQMVDEQSGDMNDE